MRGAPFTPLVFALLALSGCTKAGEERVASIDLPAPSSAEPARPHPPTTQRLVEFHRRPAVKGDVLFRRSTTGMELTVPDAPPQTLGRHHHDDEYRLEVLETDKGEISSAQMTYTAQPEDPSGVARVSETAGHSYKVVRHADALGIDRDDGAVLTPSERADVEQEARTVIFHESLDALLKKPRVVGDSLPDFAAAYAKAFDRGQEGVGPSSATMVLTNVDKRGGRDLGHFKIQLKTQMNRSPMALALTFDGTFEMDVEDATLVAMKIGGEGPLTGALKGTARFDFDAEMHR